MPRSTTFTPPLHLAPPGQTAARELHARMLEAIERLKKEQRIVSFAGN